ncbi:hypothetical protein HN371_10595 [Candidatus Poribacteria bacterium]|jgi:neutral ceramidase|nr:hypothetical protein [Candidatus Poribacteria bacterium]MBT5532560.1 hypothetical protein [Candidatus Poribacteria bacterium]MBT5715032.1 hypothetical protein [Candidatus Poribacteria bacterium]MBT7099941.1 hypothetical protein [Candidatus Poribacteria bacterium]MBT7805863.1 hypothetical protein [Candidatus Poribacteria bacterium]
MLTAGAACVDITPPLGTLIPGLFHERRAEAIHDPLHARSFVVGLGDEAIAVVVCDLIGIKRDQIDRAKAAIEDATGLPPARVLVCCTHTHTGAHTGDDAYTAFVVQRIADAVRLACERREPAEIGWASGHEDRVVFNRRFHMRDGGVRTNPGSGNADVIEAAGPVDPEVGVLCLRRAGGGTVGLLGNYALHYVGGGDHERAVSADYFGWFSQFIQALCGETFVAALANGACGDINNNDVLGTSRPKNDRYQHTKRVAALVASAAYWAVSEMELTGDASIGAAIEEVRLQRRAAPTADAVATAEHDGQQTGATMGQRAAARRVARAGADTSSHALTWVQALRIGDVALVGVPGELLVRLGLDIKRRSPFGQTMVLELANDSIGYLPDLRAFEEGGYEPEASVFQPGVGEQIADAAVALLDDLHAQA